MTYEQLTAATTKLDADVFELGAGSFAQLTLVVVLLPVRPAHHTTRRVVTKVVARFRTLHNDVTIT